MCQPVNRRTRMSTLSPKKSWRTILDLATSMALIGAAVALVWISLDARRTLSQMQGSEPEDVEPSTLPSEPLSVTTAPFLGSASAPVAIIEFSDFDCPYCSRFAAEILPVLRRDYIDLGTVRLFFKHLPLPALHPRAREAAQLAECARQHDRFWEVHDALFAEKRGSDDAALDGAFLQAGLSRVELETCKGARRPSLVQAISADVAMASQLGIAATPSFIIGKMVGDDQVLAVTYLRGIKDITSFTDALARVIDRER